MRHTILNNLLIQKSIASRVNLFAFPHKGLRNLLSQVSLLAGNTDYSDKDALQQLKEIAFDLYELLELHAQSEDNILLPALEARAPGGTLENHQEHQQLEKDIEAWFQLVIGFSTEATQYDGDLFYAAISAFHAKYLQHMEHEEAEILELIWEHFTDQELFQIQGEIMKCFTPEQVKKWFTYIVPALNPSEQIKILSGYKSKSPKESFDELLMLLKGIMPERNYKILLHRLTETSN